MQAEPSQPRQICCIGFTGALFNAVNQFLHDNPFLL
jgi:hypothetical protein